MLSKDLERQRYWEKTLSLLKKRFSRPSFETWISPLTPGEIQDNQVILHAESSFNRDWILKHYRQEIREALSQVLEQNVEINIAVKEPGSLEFENENSGEPSEEDSQIFLPEKSSCVKPDRQAPWTPRTTQSNLNPKYTFEQFIVGQHNRFCHAAALAIAESPAQSYNPFFIYGGVGLGKTHLMHAVGHFVLRHHPTFQVRYVTAEQFTNDLINALGRKEMKPFRDKYRRIDVLMIDDIQFLEGKERTQEEVFHTFNTLHEAGKQIILSSDRPPRHLSRLEDRLRSRFEWGLIADIQIPDVETRLAILYKKIERDKMKVPEDVLEYIAERYPNNIRELEGALNKVVAYALLTHAPLVLTTAQSLLGSIVDPSRISLEVIVETVADYYHMRPSDLKSQSRIKDVSHARQIAIYVLRTMTEASFPKIGDLLGGRKHTTILYAYEKVKEETEQYPLVAQQIREITRLVESKTHR